MASKNEYCSFCWRNKEDVSLLIEGKEVDTLVGHMDLSVPLGPSKDLLKSTTPPESN